MLCSRKTRTNRNHIALEILVHGHKELYENIGCFLDDLFVFENADCLDLEIEGIGSEVSLSIQKIEVSLLELDFILGSIFLG